MARLNSSITLSAAIHNYNEISLAQPFATRLIVYTLPPYSAPARFLCYHTSDTLARYFPALPFRAPAEWKAQL